MVKEIRIYVEGGGDGAEGKAKLREGFGTFLERLRKKCQDKCIRWYVIPCGPHRETCKKFEEALERYPEALCFLLIDSDHQVQGTARTHIEGLHGLRFDGVEEAQLHLMAQVMESWFLTHPEALASYFGKEFQANALPSHRNVEEVGSKQVLDALDQATRKTAKGKYHKIRHGAELLKKVSPDRVCERAQHCRRLFDEIERSIEAAR